LVDDRFLQGIHAIATGPAAANADAVDREGRFPVESFDALRAAGALSAYVPVELGGGGVSVTALALASHDLGRYCSSTAMILAMHQIQVASLVRHPAESVWLSEYLVKLSDEQRLIASVTSEVGTGGDMSRSIAAVEPADEGCVSFEKQASVVSYGEHADDLLTTVRKGPTAEPSDQVLVLTSRDQHQLVPTGTWDALGMRGTCSPSFTVTANVPVEQVLATPFAVVATETMVPLSHLLWSELWLGIATAAFDRARACLRDRARKSGGAVPAGAEKLSAVMTDLSLLRAEVGSVLQLFEDVDREPGRPRISTMSTILRFNNLKIAASEMAAQVCLDSLGTIGILGYKNDSPYSVGRQIRDVLSAALMVSNDRIHATNASLLLIAKEA
jgi:acyl-CoA dehydrogenase